MSRAMPLRLGLERLALSLAVLVLLVPVAWLLTTAYKPARDIFSIPPRLGFEPSLENFATLMGYMDVPGLAASSLVISGGATLLALVLGVPAGYALARSSSRLAVGLVYGCLAVRMVPPVATLIPFYLLMRDLGLLGTHLAVILVHAMLSVAFVTWMMFAQFRGLPREVEDAALVDGCSRFGAFWRVALPMVRSGVVASALLCLILSWNDFLYAAFLTRNDTKPLSVALLSAYGTTDITWGTMGALAHFSTAPILVLALLLNRYLVQGLTRGVH
jgi:multiple sugar transport system permease protein